MQGEKWTRLRRPGISEITHDKQSDVPQVA